jgi:CRP/FNR family transcriptional regulator
MDNFSDSVNCIDCKNSSQCFRKLIPSELEFINQHKTQIQYKKGETICKQGAFASYVLYIADGLVKIYLESPGSKNINVKISQTSEFFGLSSIFGDNIYNYSVQALHDSSICLVDKGSFKKLLLNNGNFASEVIKWYCENEKQLFFKIKSLGHKQMHGRLADILLYLCSDAFKEKNIFSYLSRKDIADFSCISTESVVRLLTELKNEKIIEMDGKNIEILQLDLLKEISRRG